MIWTVSEAKRGDIVRVKLGAIYHYGIYVGDGEIVQFGLPPTSFRDDRSVEVCATDVETFLAGGFMEVGEPEKQELKTRKTPEETVKAARARLGEKGYHILYNNCEHFAHECAFGQKYCSQVERIRAACKSLPVMDIYVRKFPFETETDGVSNNLRKREIDGCANEQVKAQKYYVWKLLEYALKRSFGLEIDKIELKKDGTKWTCKECCFSLSHSGNVAAVAISRTPVGVDIEKKDTARFLAFSPEKLMTEAEQNRAKTLEGAEKGSYINALWTVKEAAFKCENGRAFKPNQIESEAYQSQTKTVVLDGETYFLTAVGAAVSAWKLYAFDGISEAKNG
ncbi:MAG: lecithin retinol acyltransferase family protein [Clostridia bacterium]|nr:lecithin retinol acyltransferase family protein [Clostridia bacterium]